MHRKIFLALLLTVLAGTASGQNLKTVVKVDKDRKTGAIDKLLYGNFTEHLGRCIYGGIYDPQSPEANTDGFRTVTKEVKVSGETFTYTFPAHSFTQFRIKVN